MIVVLELSCRTRPLPEVSALQEKGAGATPLRGVVAALEASQLEPARVRRLEQQAMLAEVLKGRGILQFAFALGPSSA